MPKNIGPAVEDFLSDRDGDGDLSTIVQEYANFVDFEPVSNALQLGIPDTSIHIDNTEISAIVSKDASEDTREPAKMEHLQSNSVLSADITAIVGDMKFTTVVNLVVDQQPGVTINHSEVMETELHPVHLNNESEIKEDFLEQIEDVSNEIAEMIRLVIGLLL